MKILFVSAEVSPFAKVGGLADVAGSLPKALKALGHDVRIVMPSYKMVEEQHKLKRSIRSLPVQVGPGWKKEAYVNETKLGDVTVYLIGTDQWFNTATSSEKVYQGGCDQYLFFSSALLDLAKQINWKPDVVHCNDWHTGLTPVIMRERFCKAWDDVAAVFTIHNLAYQGEFGFDTLDKVGLPHHLFNMHQLETYGSVNFLKAGCTFSDQVNTVSPRYAQEIQTPEFGCRLDGLMQHLARHGRLRGIINGIDLAEFNPATDPHLPKHYSADKPEGKADCRADLMRRLGLEPIPGALLLGAVSRLSSQKGMDMVLDAAERLFEMPCQMVIQGLGDQNLAARFAELQARFPAHFRFVQAFDIPMAQRVYGGADAFLMPSHFEPCGLGQLIAMRYGTVPIVRETGGLADTVLDGVNGFSFLALSSDGLAATVRRAHEAFANPERWASMRHAGMTGEFGWEHSAVKYVELYEQAMVSRVRQIHAVG